MPSIPVSRVWPNVRLREVDVRVTSSGQWVSVNDVEAEWQRYYAEQNAKYQRKNPGKPYFPSAEERQHHLGGLDPRVAGEWTVDTTEVVVSDYFTVRFVGTAFLGAPKGRNGSARVDIAVVVDDDEWGGHVDLSWHDPLGAPGTWALTKGGLHRGDDFPLAERDREQEVRIEVGLSFEARNETEHQSIAPRVQVRGYSSASGYSIDSAPASGKVHASIEPPFRLVATPEPLLLAHGEHTACDLTLTNRSSRQKLFFQSYELGAHREPNTGGHLEPGSHRRLYTDTATHRTAQHAGLDPDAISFAPARVHDLDMLLGEGDGDTWRRTVAEAFVPPVGCLGALVDDTPPGPLPEDPGDTPEAPPARGRRHPVCANGRLVGLRGIDLEFSVRNSSTSEPSIAGHWGSAPLAGLVVSDWFEWTLRLDVGLGFGTRLFGAGGTAKVNIRVRERGGGLDHVIPLEFAFNSKLFHSWDLVGVDGRTLGARHELGWNADRTAVTTIDVRLLFQAREMGAGALEGAVELEAFSTEQLTTVEVALAGPDGSAGVDIGSPVALHLDAPDSVDHGGIARTTLVATNLTDGAEVRWRDATLVGPVGRPGLCRPGHSAVAAWLEQAHEEPHWGLIPDVIPFEPAALVEVRVPLDPCSSEPYEWWVKDEVVTPGVSVDCQGPPPREADLLSDEVELPDPPPGPYEPPLELEEPDPPRQDLAPVGSSGANEPPAESPSTAAAETPAPFATRFVKLGLIALFVIVVGGVVVGFSVLGGDDEADTIAAGSTEQASDPSDDVDPPGEGSDASTDSAADPSASGETQQGDQNDEIDESGPFSPGDLVDFLDEYGLEWVSDRYEEAEQNGSTLGEAIAAWLDVESALINAFGGATIEQTDAYAAQFGGNTTFPCGGVTSEYRVTCPLGAGPFAAGEYVVVAMQLQAPVASEPGSHTYGLAFGSADESENYQFFEPFDGDLFRNTKYWWRLHVDVDGNRSMWADGFVDGVPGVPRQSSALVIEWGDLVIFVIPRSEIPLDVLRYRLTAFNDQGDPQQIPDPATSGGDASGLTVLEALTEIVGPPVVVGDVEVLPPDIQGTQPRVEITDPPDAHIARVLIQDFIDRMNEALASGDPGQVIAMVLPQQLGGPNGDTCRADMEGSIVQAMTLSVTDMPTAPDVAQGFPFYTVATTIDYPTGSVPYGALLTPNNVDGRLYLLLPSCL